MASQTSISAVSAAQAAQTVIANNLANLQTVGAKTENIVFSSMVSGSAASGKATPSGVQQKVLSNPGQQGLLDATDNKLDLGIAGEDTFFVYADTDTSGKAQNFVYSRAGQLVADKDGYLINSSTGRKLMGYATDTEGAPTGPLGALQGLIPINITSLGILSQPKPTQTISGTTNLPATATTGAQFPTQALAYDSLGAAHTINMQWTKAAGERTWTLNVTAPDDTAGAPAPITVTFDDQGRLATPTGGTDLNFAWSNGAANSTISLDLGAAGTASALTSFSSDFSSGLHGDGNGLAQMSSISIDGTGTVFAQMTNGDSRALAKLGMAKFTCASGLAQVNGNAYQQTNEAGQLILGVAGSGGMGTIQSGALEKSTVNMTKELMFMMTMGQCAKANNAAIGADQELTNGILEVLRRN